MLAPEAGKAKVEQEEGHQDGSYKPVNHRVDTMSKCVLAKRVQLLGLHAQSARVICGSLNAIGSRVTLHGGKMGSSGAIGPFASLLAPVGGCI